MSLDNMVVYNEQLRSAVITKIEQKSDLFNAASRNTIVLRNAGNMGDFTQTSYWNGVQSAYVMLMLMRQTAQWLTLKCHKICIQQLSV